MQREGGGEMTVHDDLRGTTDRMIDENERMEPNAMSATQRTVLPFPEAAFVTAFLVSTCST